MQRILNKIYSLFVFLHRPYRMTPAMAIAVPAMFVALTGLRKMMTDAAMTTTRFNELPTEWVTGVTLLKTMKLSCWYSWKHSDAKSKFFAVTASGTPLETMYATFIFGISNIKASGKASAVDAIVMPLKRLM